MLTTTRSMNVFTANDTDVTFGAQKQVVAPCERMDRFQGEIAYTGGAPGAVPLLEFSRNGIDWDYRQPAPVGANPAPGVTLYTWDIQIVTWAFVRLTVDPPGGGGTIRGDAKIRPVMEN